MLQDNNQEVEKVETVEQVEATPQPSVGETDKEKNLRHLRERAERAERRAMELEQKLTPAPQQSTTDDDDFQFSDTDYIEGKVVKKIVRSLTNKIEKTKEEILNSNSQSHLQTVELRLKDKHKDFYDVVNDTTITQLRDKNPSLYNSIFSNKDTFERGDSLYQTIKAFGMANPSKNDDINRRIEENSKKPRTGSSIGTPMNPNVDSVNNDRRILTPERIAFLRDQVSRARERG